MVRTRFAPSPTGFLHIGSLRTAAYAYALAKHDHGEFLLRIEDTDQEREVPGAKEKIYEILKIFKLNWEGEPIIQSERAKQGAYREAALKLIETGHAFYCDCQARNAKEEGFSKALRDPCRDSNKTEGAIRLKVPDGEKISSFDFVLKKEIVWESDNVPDAVLLKSDGYLATYHLAVAVDDNLSQISHVIRSAEWVPSTPIHVLVHKFLDFPLPQIGHPTAILDPQGGKLSKRKGNVAVEEFLAQGYLPEALLNFVILLGWAPKDNREMFTLDEFVKTFDINGFQVANPVFRTEKLDWFNGQYIRLKADNELVQLLAPYVPDKDEGLKLKKIMPLVKDRITKLSDFEALAGFFYMRPNPDAGLFLSQSKQHLESALAIIDKREFEVDVLNADFKSEIQKMGYKTGDFFMSLRIAITGSKQTPPITESMMILGKDESKKRLQYALQLLDVGH